MRCGKCGRFRASDSFPDGSDACRSCMKGVPGTRGYGTTRFAGGEVIAEATRLEDGSIEVRTVIVTDQDE